MPADFAQLVPQLGVAGFAILVIWWMYKHSSERLDRKDEAMRTLERDIRERILDQLNKNTAAFDKVFDHFAKH